jgi:hypothetical protein
MLQRNYGKNKKNSHYRSSESLADHLNPTLSMCKKAAKPITLQQ